MSKAEIIKELELIERIELIGKLEAMKEYLINRITKKYEDE